MKSEKVALETVCLSLSPASSLWCAIIVGPSAMISWHVNPETGIAVIYAPKIGLGALVEGVRLWSGRPVGTCQVPFVSINWPV